MTQKSANDERKSLVLRLSPRYSRLQADFLQGDDLLGHAVLGLVDDAVGALADLLDLGEVVHRGEELRPSSPVRPTRSEN